MLATTWDKIRDEKSRLYGPNSFVYRSTDGGHTWTNVHNPPLPQSETDPALQTTANLVGKMGVDFSDSDPNRAYLISSTAAGNFNGFFTSTDAGATWTAVGPTSTGTLQTSAAASPGGSAASTSTRSNPQHVFVEGVNLAESLNGGATWTTSQTPHADQHAVEFDPFTPGRVYLGNDGGFYWSTANGAARGLWSKTPRLPVTQFYEMDVSVQDGSRVNAGSQDNGSLKSWANEQHRQRRLVRLRRRRRDDEPHRPDERAEVLRLLSERRLPRLRRHGHRRDVLQHDDPGQPQELGRPDRVRRRPALHVRRQRVHVPDGHRARRRPARLAADQPGPHRGHRAARPGFGTITAIGTTPADPNLVYAGTDSGLMWVSHNAMAAPADVTWTKLQSPVFPGRWVTRVTVDEDNAKIAWATFSGWRSGDGYPHILMTSDGGDTWVDIAGKKIPQAPINDVIRHWSKPKWLFIATDVGVYRTTNLGKTWIKVGDNLPLVPINDIDLPDGSDTLYAATYGRSVWTTSLADAS